MNYNELSTFKKWYYGNPVTYYESIADDQLVKIRNKHSKEGGAITVDGVNYTFKELEAARNNKVVFGNDYNAMPDPRHIGINKIIPNLFLNSSGDFDLTNVRRELLGFGYGIYEFIKKPFNRIIQFFKDKKKLFGMGLAVVVAPILVNMISFYLRKMVYNFTNRNSSPDYTNKIVESKFMLTSLNNQIDDKLSYEPAITIRVYDLIFDQYINIHSFNKSVVTDDVVFKVRDALMLAKDRGELSDLIKLGYDGSFDKLSTMFTHDDTIIDDILDDIPLINNFNLLYLKCNDVNTILKYYNKYRIID